MSLPIAGMANGSFEGSWKSDFGTLRLHQQGNKVFGDYKNVGTLYGTINRSTSKLVGTFSNGEKTGRFEFTLSGDKIKGKWGWGTKKPTANWSANRTSSKKPKLKNFPCTGVWRTDLGELRLLQQGSTVKGTLRSKLQILDGFYNVKTKMFSGRITGNQSSIYLKFEIKMESSAVFKGKYSRSEAPPATRWKGLKMQYSETVNTDYLRKPAVYSQETKDYTFSFRNFCIQNHNEGWGDEEPMVFIYTFRGKPGCQLESKRWKWIDISEHNHIVQRTSKIALRVNNKRQGGLWLDNFDFRSVGNEVHFRRVAKDEIIGFAVVFLERDLYYNRLINEDVEWPTKLDSYWYKEAFLKGQKADYASCATAAKEYKRDLFKYFLVEKKFIAKLEGTDFIGRDFEFYINNPKYKMPYETHDRLRMHGKNKSGDHYFLEYTVKVKDSKKYAF